LQWQQQLLRLESVTLLSATWASFGVFRNPKRGGFILSLAKVDDADCTYFNGDLIGQKGEIPPHYKFYCTIYKRHFNTVILCIFLMTKKILKIKIKAKLYKSNI
jgi:hypothetical protein